MKLSNNHLWKKKRQKESLINHKQFMMSIKVWSAIKRMESVNSVQWYDIRYGIWLNIKYYYYWIGINRHKT